ncbi:PE domain-containing protein [Mycobacterium spongiae]|uniref:PE domain-containing protein n=1 Tax=Mycobacterium spongiae TaxID=886343 RepID=UPI001BAB90E2|nr:PE domain-containing protein [Mycobacterium spongiae]
MSFVNVAPEMVAAAAANLEGIGSTITAANAAVAAQTTEVVAPAADEVSVAIAALFGTHGEAYQTLSAQAELFHRQFVEALNFGVGSYVSTEAANVQQTARNAVNTVNTATQTLLGSPLLGASASATTVGGGKTPRGLFSGNADIVGRGGLLTGLGGNGILGGKRVDLTGGGVAGLLGQAGGPVVSGLSSLASGEGAIAAALGAPAAAAGPFAVGGAYGDLLNNTSANLQGIGNTLFAEPAPFLSQFIANQQSYADIVGASLFSAGQDFGAGLAALPEAYVSAFDAFAAGDITGGVETLGLAYGNLLFTGLDFSQTPVDGSITVTGTLGDLLPITTIPGEIWQNMANLVQTVTDTSINSVIALVDPSFTMGLPLALGLDLLGAPLVTAEAALLSGTTFVNAVQTGDALGALGAIIDAPAVIADGFLNGEATLNLELPTSLSPLPGTRSLTSTIHVGGILVPLQPVEATTTFLVGPPTTTTLGGTQFGGLIPGLLDARTQLANAITPS